MRVYAHTCVEWRLSFTKPVRSRGPSDALWRLRIGDVRVESRGGVSQETRDGRPVRKAPNHGRAASPQGADQAEMRR